MADAFFLETPKGYTPPKKHLSRGSRQGENWKKSSIFHRTVEMKQPYTITELFLWGSLWDGRGKKRPAVKREKEGRPARRRAFVLLGGCMLVLGRILCMGRWRLPRRWAGWVPDQYVYGPAGDTA